VGPLAAPEATGLTDYKAAQQKLTQRLSQIDKGEYIERPAKPATIAELFEGLRRHYRVNRRRSLRSLQLRWNHLKVLADFLGINLTTERLDAYVDERLKQGASNASVNRELSALKTALRLGQLPRIPKFPHLAETNVRTGFIELHQFQRLVRETRQLWLRLFLELAFTYGWRRSELLGVRVEQVDLLTKAIRLDPSQTKNAKPREVSMTAVVYELAKQAVAGKDPSDHLLTRGRKPVRDFRDSWRKLCAKAGLGKFTCRSCEKTVTGNTCKCGGRQFRYTGTSPHDFRRSAARELRKAGVAETTIMDMAGWETRAMFKRYAIVDDSDIRIAVGKLERARAEHDSPGAENRYENSHKLTSEAQTEAEAPKGAIN
jgi:integrase